MKRNNLMCCVALACLFLIGADCRQASAKCAAGEVWGDLGCHPKAQPSLMTKAAQHIKTMRLHRKKPKHFVPAAKSQ